MWGQCSTLPPRIPPPDSPLPLWRPNSNSSIRLQASFATSSTRQRIRGREIRRRQLTYHSVASQLTTSRPGVTAKNKNHPSSDQTSTSTLFGTSKSTSCPPWLPKTRGTASRRSTSCGPSRRPSWPGCAKRQILPRNLESPSASPSFPRRRTTASPRPHRAPTLPTQKALQHRRCPNFSQQRKKPCWLPFTHRSCYERATMRRCRTRSRRRPQRSSGGSTSPTAS